MDVLQEVKEIVSDIMGFHEDEITLETHLEEQLAVDELDKIEIIMDVEDRFDIEVYDEEMDNIHTVQDMVDCVKGKI